VGGLGTASPTLAWLRLLVRSLPRRATYVPPPTLALWITGSAASRSTMIVTMITVDDVVHQFALWIARVADNPTTTEQELDTLLVAINALDDISAGRGPQPRW